MMNSMKWYGARRRLPPVVLLLTMVSSFFNLVIMLAMRPAKTPVAMLLMSLDTAPKPACLPACLPVDLTQLDTSLNTAPESVALDATLNTTFKCHLKSIDAYLPPFRVVYTQANHPPTWSQDAKQFASFQHEHRVYRIRVHNQC